MSLLARLTLLPGLTLLSAGILLSRLAVLRFLLLSRLLTRHLPREILGALSQLGLLARELLDLALQLLLGHLLAVARELLLLLEQLVLPLGELLDLVERALIRIVALLGARLRLVIGLLRLLQLSIEERRQVVVAAVVAGAAASLLTLDLALLHVVLRLQQMGERFHLRLQRGSGLERIERRHRLLHRRRGERHLIFFGQRLAGLRTLRRRRGAASLRPPPRIPHRRLAERARRLLDAILQLRLGARHRLDVLLGFGAPGHLRAAIELERRHDDVLLRRDEVVERGAAARAGHCLARGEGELLLERLDLEEEDVAARLVRTRAAREIARAHVVGNEVAGLDVEVLEEERVAALHNRALTRDGQRNGFLGAAADGIHEVEASDAVIVLGLRFDVDFLEPRHRAILRRLEHAHVGRPILEGADEVFRLAVVRHPLAIGERHTVGVVVDDLQRRGELGWLVGGQLDGLAIVERHASARSGPIGEDVHADVGAGGRVDVAAVLLGARRQTEPGRIRIVDVDARDARRVRDRHVVGRRRHRTRHDAVLERRRHRFERQREGAALVRQHVGRAPSIAVGDLELRDDRRPVADEPCLHGEAIAGLDARVTRRDV